MSSLVPLSSPPLRCGRRCISTPSANRKRRDFRKLAPRIALVAGAAVILSASRSICRTSRGQPARRSHLRDGSSLIGADRRGLLFRHLKIAKLACHIRRPRYPERGRNSGKVPIADELFESDPARLQIFNQKGNFATDSLQVQRAAKITTTGDCSEARPVPAAALPSAIRYRREVVVTPIPDHVAQHLRRLGRA